ncbi:MAG: polysaccharide biosynthesis C-terminal domain-containing protein [Firmicutes bacterium]|nr:polysaccharide biosynthesis C-terminal domain-containing protein [Bacillota bacterium]
MGLFQMAHVLFNLAVTFAVSGLCVAVSRQVAAARAHGRTGEVGRTLGRAVLLASVTGLGFWAALDRGAAFLAAGVLGEPRAASALRSIAAAVLPVSLAAALKGYFQGFLDMVPPSVAQVTEQVVRVAAMMWLVVTFREAGLERAVAGAVAGNTVGAVVALALLVWWYAARGLRRPGRPRSPGFQVPARRRVLGFRPPAPPSPRRARPRRAPGSGDSLAHLVRLSAVLALGAFILGLMDAAQTLLVPWRLQSAGLSAAKATYLYGQLHGMAYPLAGLPAIAASAIATALVPSVTEAAERRRPGEVLARAELALRLTLLLSLPATVGLVVLARPLSAMLFDIPEAGVPLAYVSAACLLISVQQTTSGVLQGLGLVAVPVWGLVAGLAANAAVTYVLTGLPGLGVNGAALGIVAGFAVAAAVNLVAVRERARLRVDLPALAVRPGLVSLGMGVVVRAVYVRLAAAGATAATLGAVLAGVAAYALGLALTGGYGGVGRIPGSGGGPGR